MATWQHIRMPYGSRKKMVYGEGQDKIAIAQDVLLSPWSEYCLTNWLSPGADKPQSKEARIKNFLDDCAYLLLRDDPEDTMTAYKEMARGSSEIPVSSCPPAIKRLFSADGSVMVEDDRQRRRCSCTDVKKGSLAASHRNNGAGMRSVRINSIRAMHPGCEFFFCRVDTENGFTFRNNGFQIAKSVAAYSPKQTKAGLLYDMDQVVVVEHEAGLSFYDLSFEPIPDT